MNSRRPHSRFTWRGAALFVTGAALVAAAWGLAEARHHWRQNAKYSTEKRPPLAVVPRVPEQPNPDSKVAETSASTSPNRAKVEPDARDKLAKLTARLERDSENVEALRDRGLIYYETGDFDQAEVDLALTLKLAPSQPSVWAAYGYLKQLRNRPDDAIVAYDTAIDLGLKNAEVFCNRAELRRKSKQYRDAIADWNAAIALLPHEGGSKRERELRFQLYNGRGCSWAALGSFDKALQDFEQLAELQPNWPFPHAEVARVHFARHDYDQFTSCLWRAIRLNPDDAGKDYELATDSQLSADALSHGEEQVRMMLKDRPALAEHVSPGDEIWTWTVRRFGGEGTGMLVDWNSSDPSPFEADFGRSRTAGHAQIRVREVLPASPSGQADRFQRFWVRVVFELHNVGASADFRCIDRKATSGDIGREEYVFAKCRTEDRAAERTRAFYLKLFLPLLRSKNKNLSATSAHQWYCFAFHPNDDARKSYWQARPHWAYYSTWFDLLRAEAEFKRGQFVQMTDHLDLVETQKNHLTSQQSDSLRYWRDLLREVQAAK
jgi:tetratricopeptide (TPR) repeat protein